MKFSDCKIGQEVYTHDGYRGTIIGLDATSPRSNVCVGFTGQQPTGSWTLDKDAIDDLVADKRFATYHPSLLKYFQYAYWHSDCNLNLTSFLEKKAPSISTTSKMDGIMCSYCANFFPMAVGNQPDGCLKCYSCRDSNRIKKVF